jgi:hypothetical protein
MERRNEVRSTCEMNALLLMFGCHFQASIADWSRTGIRLVLGDGLHLARSEVFILHGGRFGVVHGEVIWSQAGEIGARIKNPKSAAIARHLHRQITSIMPA